MNLLTGLSLKEREIMIRMLAQVDSENDMIPSKDGLENVSRTMFSRTISTVSFILFYSMGHFIEQERDMFCRDNTRGIKKTMVILQQEYLWCWRLTNLTVFQQTDCNGARKIYDSIKVLLSITDLRSFLHHLPSSRK